MNEDYHKQLRRVDKVLNQRADRDAFENKVRDCSKRVYNFVEKEISKGMTPYSAIEKVLDSKGLGKLCPDLENDRVRRAVRTAMLNYYFRGPNKRRENEENKKEGER